MCRRGNAPEKCEFFSGRLTVGRPTLNREVEVRILAGEPELDVWPSGRRHCLGKAADPFKGVPRVRIPPHPPVFRELKFPVANWKDGRVGLIAPVSKAGDPKGSGGSNPSPSARTGSVAERSMAAVLKTVGPLMRGSRGFESHRFLQAVAGSSNGRTADFESVNGGSNPSPAANEKARATAKMTWVPDAHIRENTHIHCTVNMAIPTNIKFKD